MQVGQVYLHSIPYYSDNNYTCIEYLHRTTYVRTTIVWGVYSCLFYGLPDG